MSDNNEEQYRCDNPVCGMHSLAIYPLSGHETKTPLSFAICRKPECKQRVKRYTQFVDTGARLVLIDKDRLKGFELRAQRYEKLRRLNVPQFSELFAKNISTGIHFDTLVDELDE